MRKNNISVKNMLKKYFLEDLKKVDIKFIHDYVSKNREFIDTIYKNNFVDENSIDKALEVAVFSTANKDYKKIVNSGFSKRLDDFFVSPECLVYAWQKGQINTPQFEQIRMDHGYSVATIGERYKTKNLLSELREIIINEKPRKSVIDYNPHFEHYH